MDLRKLMNPCIFAEHCSYIPCYHGKMHIRNKDCSSGTNDTNDYIDGKCPECKEYNTFIEEKEFKL